MQLQNMLEDISSWAMKKIPSINEIKESLNKCCPLYGIMSTEWCQNVEPSDRVFFLPTIHTFVVFLHIRENTTGLFHRDLSAHLKEYCSLLFCIYSQSQR